MDEPRDAISHNIGNRDGVFVATGVRGQRFVVADEPSDLGLYVTSDVVQCCLQDETPPLYEVAYRASITLLRVPGYV